MLFEVWGLRKNYDGVEALNVSMLSLLEGKVIGLIGPNGAGKTTLLELMAGLMPATSGTVRFKDCLVTHTEATLDVRRRMTYLSQNPVMFRGRVLDNVAYGLKVRGVRRAERRRRALEALDEVGLSPLAHREANGLSSGERQRAAFARAMCIQPEAILLDEPTANVDQGSVEVLHNLVRRLNLDRHISVVFTSHDIQETIPLSDRIVALERGRLVPSPVENLFSGTIEHSDERSFVRISDALRVEVITDKIGKAKITINPQGIILSREPVKSSARNTFRGIVTYIEKRGHAARVVVDIGVALLAEITQSSRQEMGLVLGMPVYISFKSTSVAVY